MLAMELKKVEVEEGEIEERISVDFLLSPLFFLLNHLKSPSLSCPFRAPMHTISDASYKMMMIVIVL